MVLTNIQRRDLHAGIYEYLMAQGPAFEDAALALAEADPSCVRENNSTVSLNNLTIDENNPDTTSSDDASVSSRMSLRSTYSTGGLTVASSSTALTKIANTPTLERKWTAVPRLQKKILELEKIIRSSRTLRNGNMMNGRGGKGIVLTGGSGAGTGVGGNEERRMLPRPPCNYELKGHTGVVACVAIHPTSTIAVSGSEDGMIKLWDHESGEYVRTLKGHTNTVHSLSFTPTGSHLVSTSSDLTIKIWDFTTHSCVRTLRGHEHTVSCAKFLPSLSTLNANKGTLQTAMNGSGSNSDRNTSGIDTTQTGSNILVSASRDKTVKFWDLESGYCQHTMNEHNDWIRCLAIREYDGRKMATAGNDTAIFVYDLLQDTIRGGEEFGSGSCVKIATLTGHEHVIECIAFVTSATSNDYESKNVPTSPDKKATSEQKHRERINDFLASGSRDRTVKLWNFKTQTCVASFAHHKNWVRSVVLHPSGKYILSSSDDRSIRVMEIHSQRCLRTITDAHPHFVTCIAMHHSLPIMVSGGVDQTIRCWHLE